MNIRPWANYERGGGMESRGEGELECSICLLEGTKGNPLQHHTSSQGRPCAHLYHGRCLDQDKVVRCPCGLVFLPPVCRWVEAANVGATCGICDGPCNRIARHPFCEMRYHMRCLATLDRPFNCPCGMLFSPSKWTWFSDFRVFSPANLVDDDTLAQSFAVAAARVIYGRQQRPWRRFWRYLWGVPPPDWQCADITEYWRGSHARVEFVPVNVNDAREVVEVLESEAVATWQLTPEEAHLIGAIRESPLSLDVGEEIELH